jgi:hypothetical protein
LLSHAIYRQKRDRHFVNRFLHRQNLIWTTTNFIDYGAQRRRGLGHVVEKTTTRRVISMMRNIKMLGLAVLAISAMGIVGASAAQAGVGELHVETGPNADITGEQTEQHVFLLTEFGVETRCTQALFEGTISGAVAGQTTATEATLTPQYTGCTSFFGSSATVNMNGCKYTITGGKSELTAEVDITGCTSGKGIEIVTSLCTVKVPVQTGLSHIVFANVAGPPKDVNAQVTVQGITYEFSAGSFCPGAKGVLHHDGDYTGKATFKGFVDQGKTTLTTHNGHQFNKLVCGAQVGLFAT